MSDLNLLPSEAKFQAQKIHLKGLITNFLWIFGGFWLLLILIVLGTFLVFKINLDQLTKKYDKSLVQYKALVGDMAINQKIRYEAKIVSKILSERFEYGESMDIIKNLFSEKIKIENLEINGNKKFTIDGSVDDGRDMDEVENKIDNINKGLVDSLISAEIVEIKPSPSKWKFVIEVNLR